MPRTYKLVYGLCALLLLAAAALGPLAAIQLVATLNDTKARASTRITGLQAQVNTLQKQITAAVAGQAVLAEQVRSLGGQPAVPVPVPTTAPTTQPAPTTTTTRPSFACQAERTAGLTC